MDRKTDCGNLLANLPSQGKMIDCQDPTVGTLRKYVCLHDTSAPASQVIATDSRTMLIRSFSLRKKKRSRKKTGTSKKRSRLSSGSTSQSLKRGRTPRELEKRNDADTTSQRHRRLELASLREELQRQGLDTVGTESELRARLRQHQEEGLEAATANTGGRYW